MKHCRSCLLFKDISAFNKDKSMPDGKDIYCRDCRKAYGLYYTIKVKQEVFNAYGGRCACCGEERLEFLAIDHVHGNGNTHRKLIGKNGGRTFYNWLKKNNYPNDFRLLCHNCNHSYGSQGYCPHQIEKGELNYGDTIEVYLAGNKVKIIIQDKKTTLNPYIFRKESMDV